MAKLPLDGIRVVDFTQLVAGPHATLWLASLGAEVIKIETRKRPDPFRMSQPRPGEELNLNKNPLFIVSNLMKKDCSINIADPGGRDLCLDLIRESDVVVENFKAGVMEQFGLGYADLCRIKPEIIMASVSGYGHTGAYAGFAGLAPNMHAFSGLSWATGYLDGPPEQLFMYYADIPPGQTATLGILAALRHRARTGEGQYIDVAMSEVIVAVAPEPVVEYAMTGQSMRRRGNRDPVMAPHGCYPCAGVEQWLAIAVATEDQWRTLTQILGHPEWADDGRFVDAENRRINEDLLDAAIADVTRPQNAHDLANRLLAGGVPAAPSNTVKDLLEDPQLLAREFIVEIDQPEAGAARLPRLPWRLSTVEGQPFGPAPLLGESTDEVLRQVLKLSDAEIAELREAGAIT